MLYEICYEFGLALFYYLNKNKLYLFRRKNKVYDTAVTLFLIVFYIKELKYKCGLALELNN